MDPNATYSEMRRAYAEQRWDEAAEHARALIVWVRHGGFPPAGVDKIKCIGQCEKVIARTRQVSTHGATITVHKPTQAVAVPLVPVGMKPCPFCAEPVQDAAVKCRHCSEFLDPALRVAMTASNGPSVNQSVVVNAGNYHSGRRSPIGEMFTVVFYFFLSVVGAYLSSIAIGVMLSTVASVPVSSMIWLCFILTLVLTVLYMYLFIKNGR